MIDLNAADRQEIEALSRLREPGTQPVLRLIASELEATKQKLVYAGETDVIRRLQGRAEALEDLLRAADDALSVNIGARAPG